MASKSINLSLLLIISLATMAFSGPLKPDFYDQICPKALPAIRRVVEEAVQQERRMGASLLRLHFHDCFVNGCDGSILLDSTPRFTSEKFALANNNSARGFEVIDRIKWEVDRVCNRPVVSCADILAVAARDSVVALGGPKWKVELGRRDSTSASVDRANADIPAPFMDLKALIKSFKKQGLNVRDLVALSGAHTIGFAQCFTFRSRVHDDTRNVDATFARQRQATCPRTGGDSNLAPLDPTAADFDTKYFGDLMKKKGLLHSDQELFNGDETGSLVATYSSNPDAFARDFADSMVKMAKIKPLTGKEGQIRYNCRRVNNH